VGATGSVMKVFVACPSLNFSGGAERLCMYLIEALRRKHHNVVLATLDRTDWAALEKAFGVSFKPDKEIYLFSSMPRIPTLTIRQAFVALFYVLELSWLISKKEFDLLINMRGEIVDSIGDIVYVNSVPLKLMHKYPEIQPRQGTQWKLYSRVYSFIMRSQRKGENTIVANSSFTGNIIQENLNKKALIVYPAIDVENTTPTTQANREDLVITISRLRSAKKLDIIPEIAQRVSNAKFALIGNADRDSTELLARIAQENMALGLKDRVQIFKNVSFGFILRKMQVAKAILQTQPTEAFGMAIVEAMASGCVPVVPRAGGPWYDILHQKQGWYGYSYRNAEEAAELLKMLLEDDQLRAEVSARAQLRAKDFSSSSFERNMLGIIEKTYVRKIRKKHADCV
jgi:glycosyltransferase involved in cell wall biosynthesis